MNPALYDPFVEATRNVFQLMLDLSAIDRKPEEDFSSGQTLDISIGVVGDLTGEVIYRFPERTSLNMVNIMSGMELDCVDDFVTSAISEIANIISGNVMTLLASGDVTCDILPPKPANGGHDSAQSSCCLSTSAGDVCLDIRMNPSPSK